ncbi:MAG: hypothetical protein KatS3mg026_0657 [Bacteroidia bacterium]|nr:MAG: hypothetical protein KatS3mg026_0657 [Bacteroidia bacterium]
MGSWLRWTGLVLGGCMLYQVPFWLHSYKRLKDPALYRSCQESPYCTFNLKLGPVEWFVPGGDTPGYLEPVYGLLQHGMYQPDYRMPGYGAIFGLVYLLTRSWDLALWVLAVGGLLVWAAGMGGWAAQLEKQGYKPLPIALGMGLVLASPLTYYGRAPVTEPYAVGLGLIGLYALYRRWWVGAGLGLTWAFFMRPVLGVWLAPAGLYAWHTGGKKALALLSLPFCLLEGAWILRNARLYGDFRPLSGTHTTLALGMYEDITPGVRALLGALGYDTGMIWCEAAHPYGLLLCRADSVPPLKVWKKAFASLEGFAACPPESLYAWGRDICALLHSPSYVIAHRPLRLDDPAPSPENCAQEALLLRRLQACAEAYKAAHPWRGVAATLRRLRDLAYVPTCSRPTSPLRKAYYGLFAFLLALILIAAGLLSKRRNPFMRVCAAFA